MKMDVNSLKARVTTKVEEVFNFIYVARIY